MYTVKGNELSKQLDIAFSTKQRPLFRILLRRGAKRFPYCRFQTYLGGENIEKHRLKLVEGLHSYKGKVTSCLGPLKSNDGSDYNKDMFKAAGDWQKQRAKPPKTVTEMVECAKNLQIKREYGIIIPLKWSAWFGYMSKDVLHLPLVTTAIIPLTVNTIIPALSRFGSDYADEIRRLFVIRATRGIDNDPARAKDFGSVGSIGCRCFIRI